MLNNPFYGGQPPGCPCQPFWWWDGVLLSVASGLFLVWGTGYGGSGSVVGPSGWCGYHAGSPLWCVVLVVGMRGRLLHVMGCLVLMFVTSFPQRGVGVVVRWGSCSVFWIYIGNVGGERELMMKSLGGLSITLFHLFLWTGTDGILVMSSSSSWSSSSLLPQRPPARHAISPLSPLTPPLTPAVLHPLPSSLPLHISNLALSLFIISSDFLAVVCVAATWWPCFSISSK